MMSNSLLSSLEKLGACDPAMEWVGNRCPRKAWIECNKPDWLLWVLIYLDLTWEFRQALAAILEQQALPHAGTAKSEVAEVIRLLRCKNSSKDEFLLAARVAFAARVANAARAARVAADAARYAAYAAVDAVYYAGAADAAVDAVYYAGAADAARARAAADQCQTIREVVSWKVIEKAAQEKNLL